MQVVALSVQPVVSPELCATSTRSPMGQLVRAPGHAEGVQHWIWHIHPNLGLQMQFS
jgi:hypothetical protein